MATDVPFWAFHGHEKSRPEAAGLIRSGGLVDPDTLEQGDGDT